MCKKYFSMCDFISKRLLKHNLPCFRYLQSNRVDTSDQCFFELCIENHTAMKKGFLQFWFSVNRDVYIELSSKFKTNPWRVYYLAHGKRTRSLRDNRILQELQIRGIIHEIIPW